jgi:hypothetical protein
MREISWMLDLLKLQNMRIFLAVRALFERGSTIEAMIAKHAAATPTKVAVRDLDGA